MTIFQQIVNKKGWTFVEIGKRWGKSERQISRIASAGNQRDIDAAEGLPNLEEVKMNEFTKYFGITAEQFEELGVELMEDSGSSGDMVYSYYFYVPEDTPDDILDNTGWKPGQLIGGIPTSIMEIE